MSFPKTSRAAQLLVGVGLLLVVMPFLLKEFIPVNDFFRGLFGGVGIALEILGLIRMRQLKKAEAPGL